jgi:DNA-binding transcriptional LysR family regulator
MPNMNFELGDLRAFVAVADRGSFHAAAAELHLSQPALSRRIAKLEAALGVRLLERTTRKVELTTVGRDFARKTVDLLNGLDHSLLGIAELAERMSGEVTIACVPSAVRHFLPEVLKRYHAKYPGILLRVVDQGAGDALSSVVRGEADFGINYIGAQEPNIEFEAVLKEPFVVACRHDHPLATRKKVSWAELEQYDYMTVAKASGNRFLLDLALAGTPRRPRPFCEVRHVMSMVSLVEAGLGIAAVPKLAMPAGPHPLLCMVPLFEPVVTRTLGLIRRRGHVMSPAAQELYAMFAALRQRRVAIKSGRRDVDRRARSS